MAAAVREWTEAQRRAIRQSGRSLLVSAAAGSGKTAVLAERCVFLVCDAADPCDVDELLIVTFTEAAAAEMRGRIQESLTARISGMTNPPPRLARQLALIEHAQISTIHSFCARLLRQNFNLADIDPQFAVIDPDEAALLRREVGRELFEDHYDRDAEGQFHAFIDSYGDGNDEQLMEQVARAYELLCSLESPRKWMRNALARITEGAAKPLRESELGRELLQAVGDELGQIARRCAAAIQQIKSLKGFGGYVSRLEECAAILSDWIAVFERDGLDRLIQKFHAYESSRAPSISNETPNKEQAKAIFESVRNSMKQKSNLAELLEFSEEQWLDGQQRIAPAAEVFLKLVDEFGQRYRQAKDRRRGVDFADLERKSLDLLRDRGAEQLLPSAVARACHRQYRHVMVDEYQDVNAIQDAILRLVSAECVAGEASFPGNLFTVGDVKQSVYRFRLAEPDRFLQRDKLFRSARGGVGEVIDLQENFRGRGPLLEAINEVFRRLMSEEAVEIEYDQRHELRAPTQNLFPPEDGHPRFVGAPVELHVLTQVRGARLDSQCDEGAAEDDLEQIEYEAGVCARRILQIVGKDGARPMYIGDRPAEFGDVVILMRSLRRKSDDFARILARFGIPVHNTGGSGFFAATEVRDVIALLSLLDNQQQDIPMAAVLRGPLARIANSEDAMARIRLAYPRDGQEIVPFHQAVVRYANEKEDDLAKQLRELLATLSGWREIARQRPLADLVWRIYEESGYLAFVSGLEDGHQRAANLIDLHRRARQFGAFLDQGLHRFMSFLDRLREETDLSQASASDENQSAVRIMSIHRSKGLEFPIVIVPDLGKRHNLSDCAGSILLDRRSGLGIKVVDQSRLIRYPSLSWTLTRRSLRRQTLAEEMRVLYVAMTRAQEHLILVGSDDETAAERWAGDYAGFEGALPGEAVLAATSMLDWLGPVQAACGEKTIQLFAHSADELQSLAAVKSPRKPLAPEGELAGLRPLLKIVPVDEKAAGVIARLEFVYPHQRYTTLAAATSPSAMKRDGVVVKTQAVGGGELSAAEIGDATHLVLEHLNYARACDGADIELQIEELAARSLLNDAQAKSVSRDAIAWFVATDLGMALKRQAARIRREIPFALAAASESTDPKDAVMIRGRIDLIFPTDGGYSIVDYKTDRVTASGVDRQAEKYQHQIEIYRQAMQRIAGIIVTDVYLVFLHPRIIWKAVDESLLNARERDRRGAS